VPTQFNFIECSVENLDYQYCLFQMTSLVYHSIQTPWNNYENIPVQFWIPLVNRWVDTFAHWLLLFVQDFPNWSNEFFCNCHALVIFSLSTYFHYILFAMQNLQIYFLDVVVFRTSTVEHSILFTNSSTPYHWDGIV